MFSPLSFDLNNHGLLSDNPTCPPVDLFDEEFTNFDESFWSVPTTSPALLQLLEPEQPRVANATGLATAPVAPVASVAPAHLAPVAVAPVAVAAPVAPVTAIAVAQTSSRPANEVADTTRVFYAQIGEHRPARPDAIMHICAELRPFFTQEYFVNGVSLGLGFILHGPRGADRVTWQHFYGVFLLGDECVVALGPLVTTDTRYDLSVARVCHPLAKYYAAVAGDDQFAKRVFHTRSNFAVSSATNAQFVTYCGLTMPLDKAVQNKFALQRMARLQRLVALPTTPEVVYEVELSTGFRTVRLPPAIPITRNVMMTRAELGVLPANITDGVPKSDANVFPPVKSLAKPMTLNCKQILQLGMPFPKSRNGNELLAIINGKDQRLGTNPGTVVGDTNPYMSPVVRKQVGIVSEDVMRTFEVAHVQVGAMRRRIGGHAATTMPNARRGKRSRRDDDDDESDNDSDDDVDDKVADSDSSEDITIAALAARPAKLAKKATAAAKPPTAPRAKVAKTSATAIATSTSASTTNAAKPAAAVRKAVAPRRAQPTRTVKDDGQTLTRLMMNGAAATIDNDNNNDDDGDDDYAVNSPVQPQLRAMERSAPAIAAALTARVSAATTFDGQQGSTLARRDIAALMLAPTQPKTPRGLIKAVAAKSPTVALPPPAAVVRVPVRINTVQRAALRVLVKDAAARAAPAIITRFFESQVELVKHVNDGFRDAALSIVAVPNEVIAPKTARAMADDGANAERARRNFNVGVQEALDCLVQTQRLPLKMEFDDTIDADFKRNELAPDVELRGQRIEINGTVRVEWGCVAVRGFATGETIGCYAGEFLPGGDEQLDGRAAVYELASRNKSLSDDHYAVGGVSRGEEVGAVSANGTAYFRSVLRSANHSSDNDNAVFVPEYDTVRGGIAVRATRDIKAGEAILINYGESWEDETRRRGDAIGKVGAVVELPPSPVVQSLAQSFADMPAIDVSGDIPAPTPADKVVVDETAEVELSAGLLMPIDNSAADFWTQTVGYENLFGPSSPANAVKFTAAAHNEATDDMVDFWDQ